MTDDPIRLLAAAYAVLFAVVTSLNYVPGLTDEFGRTFGLFALDIYDDALHGGSCLWAATAAAWSRRASGIFFRWFGTLYCLDGLLGLATGSGYLDLGICINGVLDIPFGTKILLNLPHIAIGGFAAFAGFVLDRAWRPPAAAGA
jgi:hypothetical protein